MPPDRQDVVIGTGPLGRAVAAALHALGRRPWLINRAGGFFDGMRARACDVARPGALAALLPERVRLYVCASPPYTDWPRGLPALVDGLLAAVRGREADLVYADNFDAYGDTGAPMHEDTPYLATTVKGRARARAAERLMDAHARDGVRVAIVRAADVFGPGAVRSVVGQHLVRLVRAGWPAHVPGNPDLPHSLTFLPDHAAALLAIGDADDAYGRAWHTPNHAPRTLREVLAELAACAGQTLQLHRAGPSLLRVTGAFRPELRELVEMLYRFDKPFVVDHARTAARFGLPPTPWARALAATLALPDGGA